MDYLLCLVNRRIILGRRSQFEGGCALGHRTLRLIEKAHTKWRPLIVFHSRYCADDAGQNSFFCFHVTYFPFLFVWCFPIITAMFTDNRPRELYTMKKLSNHFADKICNRTSMKSNIFFRVALASITC